MFWGAETRFVVADEWSEALLEDTAYYTHSGKTPYLQTNTEDMKRNFNGRLQHNMTTRMHSV